MSSAAGASATMPTDTWYAVAVAVAVASAAEPGSPEIAVRPIPRVPGAARVTRVLRQRRHLRLSVAGDCETNQPKASRKQRRRDEAS